MFLFKCCLTDSDSLRFGRTQARTNDPGQVSVFLPSSNARWQFTAVACLVTYRCGRPLDPPNICILTSPSGNSPQSVDSSRSDLHLRICSSSLPDHLTCSDTIDNVSFLSFLGSWICQCLSHASCIASCCYTGYCSPYHRCVILSLRLRRHSMSKHDFQVLYIRCKRKILCQSENVLGIIIGSHLGLDLNKKKNYGLSSEVVVRLCRYLQKLTSRDLYTGIYSLAGTAGSPEVVCSTSMSHKTTKESVGGGCSRTHLFSLVSDHLVPGSTEYGQDSMLRYVGHVDEIELLTYSSPEFVRTSVPLNVLFTFLPLVHARKIAAVHGISVGSRGSTMQLMMQIENHSCIRCRTFFTVFSLEPTPEKLTARRVANFKAKEASRKAKIDPQKTLQTHEFPPAPADYSVTHAILSNICSKMKPLNLEEAGCAVCGELKPVGMLSRLKGIKNLLSVIEAQGVTRIERKSMACPIKEYSGPVLDHSCSQVCDGCRRDIRKGKVPRLALANNLWIGKVPDVLKNLRYVEKILVARVRHTCAYVKVASGMRKMKANVVAFESPTPKIYTVLPPPRDDIDDVLAILFTGPSKPTPADFARTPFLVRRNAVINALNWLKLNHADYADIEVSETNMKQYQEDMPPVSVEYRESSSNKVPEGTSVFDQTEEEGTEQGDCAFTVHGLTGELLQTMSPNALKALALRHLNSSGKMLAVGHSDKPQSMWNNPQLYPQMFPWLFPYGVGGIGASSISHKEHKRHLLMYHDKRFQTDINFPFVAFSHEQIKASTTQSFLLVEQRRFTDISRRLMSVNLGTLNALIERLEAGEHIVPETEPERLCFQLIKDIDAIAGKMHGSTTSKKYMRNEIWSLVSFLGAPSWYITLSPADIQHPLCVYYAGTQTEFRPTIAPYDERLRSVCSNPVAGARFFHFMVETFIADVLGVNTSHRGLYGDTGGYYGTVEQQGRLTLHLHMLLWIKGNINPQEMREKILKSDSLWQKKLIDWLESCHTGDFLTGNYAEVSESVGKKREEEGYIDPTQLFPEAPPKQCVTVHGEREEENCKSCRSTAEWADRYATTVDDLLLRSNVHSCSRGTNKDGTRKKNKASGSCMDNKWNKCKARFPRPTFLKTVIDELGTISMKKIEAWLNTFTPLVTYALRCNTDVTSLSSGTAIKAVVLYVSDYITKSTLKTHTIFDSIRSIFQKNSEMINGTLPMKEKARRFMAKVANLLSAKAEMGAPMICMYLLGNPDHYTSHTFIPFYWQSYVGEVRRIFEEVSEEQPKMTLIKKKGKIIGLSPVQDYVYRAPELEHVNLYEWIRCYKREKLRRREKGCAKNEDTGATDIIPEEDAVSAGDGWDTSFQSVESYTEINGPASSRSDRDKSKKHLYCFTKEHPLHETHAMRFVPDNALRIPSFVGASLPRRDQGDREHYCCSMLTIFKPWRSGLDLKRSPTVTWVEEFANHNFRHSELAIMKNFNIRYECLDARDDYRAQLKNGSPQAFVGSWTAEKEETDCEDVGPDVVEFDDLPEDPANIGPKHSKRLKETETINSLLSSTGWTEPVQFDFEQPNFQPEKFFPGSMWEREVDRKKQEILGKKNEHNMSHKVSGLEGSSNVVTFQQASSNVVKVVDKSYLEKSFSIDHLSEVIQENVNTFSLNTEQERAFRIIANHAISANPEQLRMYLGGMGGTGKTQVIKALSSFFEGRKEAHRFIIVAPTGTAAALLGGSTYHSMFGINERMNASKIGHIKAKLSGVEYVFFDEVSMLSARDLYRINSQLANVCGVNDIPFGGLNMVFSGDFAQLPPAVGRENVSLYSKSIGAVASDKKSQEEAIGKALWHQITTVVILRQNMRQKKQSPEDAKLRTALENMRYKACTAEDISFLRTLVSSEQPGRMSVCSNDFRNVSIITGTNLHKDEINRLGAIRFAQETNQELTDFYSDDTVRVTRSSSETHQAFGAKRVSEISEGMQKALWDQQPSTTDKHIAGKLSLCIGLPVMIRYNFATELCMTRGQEGIVYGWQSKTGLRGQRTLDTLFVELKNPPTDVQIDGLPKNVVPVYATTNNLFASLPNDDRYYISRTQVEVLVNFAMTDFASQGKTRLFNAAHLNYLTTHQAYYTALSRSATASGTLILQGFDARIITGGCSGALRQEFRELELLDEITLRRYMGKLQDTVYGPTRNTLIAAFRECKGTQYVPMQVHRAIRWSKRDPLHESDVYDLSKLNIKSTIPTVDLSAVPNLNQQHAANTKKRRRSSSSTVTRAHSLMPPASGRPTKKTKHLGNNSAPLSGHNYTHRVYYPPTGMVWSQNSCAYDSIFTILFNIWCRDMDNWGTIFTRLGNEFCILLVNEFTKYVQNEISLEAARDTVRKELHKTSEYMRFGAYTSIDEICGAIFTTPDAIYRTYYQCPDNHQQLHSQSHTIYLSRGRSPFKSTTEWMQSNSQQGTNKCGTCDKPVNINISFIEPPPLVILEFSGSEIDIDDSFEVAHLGQPHKYSLAGVVYYKDADQHFVSNIVTPDKQLWFYDGMSNGGHMSCLGPLAIHQPATRTQCRGGSASAAFYIISSSD
jgi:hypothetical protein